MIKKLIVLSTSLLIIGCSSTPQEKRLDQYLEDTKTDAKERSIDWYYKHDYERSNVLNICYSIYIDSAKKAGYYSDDVSDGREKYLDDSVQKEMYASNDECNKAKPAPKMPISPVERSEYFKYCVPNCSSAHLYLGLMPKLFIGLVIN